MILQVLAKKMVKKIVVVVMMMMVVVVVVLLVLLVLVLAVAVAVVVVSTMKMKRWRDEEMNIVLELFANDVKWQPIKTYQNPVEW